MKYKFIIFLVLTYLFCHAENKYNFNCDPKSVPGYPFITGDAFRSIAHYVLDYEHTFDPRMVTKPSIIFVTTDYLDKFFKYFHHKILSKYVLITHNYTDNSIPISFLQDFSPYLYHPKLIHWFGKNTCLQHPKLTTLPIGPRLGIYSGDVYQSTFNNEHLRHYDGFHFIPEAFDSFSAAVLSAVKAEKKYFAYLNLRLHTHPDRNVIHQLFSEQEYVHSCLPCEFKEYLNHLSESHFVFSPPGYGLDCHRTWEALHLGCIPIVKTSPIDHLFKDLPVLIVDDWSKVDKEMLDKYLATNQSKNFNHPKLFLDYWFDLILEKLNS